MKRTEKYIKLYKQCALVTHTHRGLKQNPTQEGYSVGEWSVNQRNTGIENKNQAKDH